MEIFVLVMVVVVIPSAYLVLKGTLAGGYARTGRPHAQDAGASNGTVVGDTGHPNCGSNGEGGDSGSCN